MKPTNSVLLLLNQSKTVPYSYILSKISGNYSSINSARAALSRALRSLAAKGLIVKQKNAYFITAKGKKLIETDMYTVLLLSLSSLIYKKDAVKEIPSIVKQLSILIEWSKLNKGLLETARQNQKLEIKMLKSLHKKFKKKIKQDQYLAEVFSDQIKQLKNWNFKDSYELYINRENIKQLETFLKKTCLKEFFFYPGFNDNQFFEKKVVRKNQDFIEKKKDFYQVPLSCTKKIVNYLLETKNFNSAKIFYKGIEVLFTEKEIIVMGRYDDIKVLKELCRP